MTLLFAPIPDSWLARCAGGVYNSGRLLNYPVEFYVNKSRTSPFLLNNKSNPSLGFLVNGNSNFGRLFQWQRCFGAPFCFR
jgi:hypothetical protein